MSDRDLLMLSTIGLLNAVLTHVLLRNFSWILMKQGVVGLDVNKPDRPRIPEEGGIAITISLMISFALHTHFFGYRWMPLIMLTTLLIACIGVFDHFRELRPYPKMAYCALIGGIYSGSYLSDTSLGLPGAIVAFIAVALAYSLLVNAFNLLAGFNGLESGLAVLSSGALGTYFLVEGRAQEASIAFLVTISYAVSYNFNRYPAKLFIGNSGTLIPASIYVGLGLFTGEWLPVLFVMAPHLINGMIRFASTGVSSRSNFSPLIYRGGLLHLPPNSYLSLIRMYLKSGPKHERSIVRYVLALECAFCLLMFIFL
jgi:UDP-N-acetylglucosamine--dolichyl-phosphate N-acetylglucosaminephosphotransferase